MVANALAFLVYIMYLFVLRGEVLGSAGSSLKRQLPAVGLPW
jgi:hypothetical protein